MTEVAKSQAEIFDHIAGVLVDLFELEREDITPESNLYEDLDIDSIDAIDLVVELKQWTGKKIQPEAFKAVRTVQDVVNAVDQLLQK
ncbi:acyl carrier protein [Marinobacter sp. M3C]|jgi:acyl carrier protein|uniref:acyl carrier protein n=1 Tax=Marinobacter sp. M3C TaxID=2917715 RepID=UPI00200DFD1B|nr:acyl carrier protein [Marinobacter sp. M3C]MCL1478839.1 acyl carrier protein [Marinobacter sp.]MCL1484094.1 acyl carrier protein [Marinobacter sp.]MCL1487430.1 acyl carrier protein [Marinobacter sp.]UQG61150.1 acyl carrier protein [Marinobacter sp. M3C]